jgi:hypothetical protein
MVILFISLFVALCVKLDPSTHKIVHLGLAFKLGVIVTFVKGKLEDARQARRMLKGSLTGWPTSS